MRSPIGNKPGFQNNVPNVEVYPAAQAFKPNEIIKAVVTGSIEAGVSTNFQRAGMLPIMDAVLIPWLITDLPVIQKALSGLQ